MMMCKIFPSFGLRSVYGAVFVGLVVLLTGCAPSRQQLGFSASQWQAMTPLQQKEAGANYAIIQKIFQKNNTATVYDGPSIRVQLLQGTVLMPPFDRRYDFEPVSFTIAPGPCRRVRLDSVDTTDYVDMRLCYNGLRLSLDPSYYDITKSEGTVHFYYNPLWKRGFTYRDVATDGYVHLENTSITITTNTPAT